MKKLFILPILVLTLFVSSCQKEEIIQNIYQGSYVFTEYASVAWDQWSASLVPTAPGASTWKTDYLYYTYTDAHIDQDLVENSFVAAYLVDAEDCDVQLPLVRTYVDGGGVTHTYSISYKVGLGKVMFIVDAVDKNYDNIVDYLPDVTAFKVCMVKN